MGKDLKGKNLGKGFSQRKDGRYEARAVINGIKIDMYDLSLPTLKKNFEEAKMKLANGGIIAKTSMPLLEWYTDWFKKCKSPQLKNDVSRNVYNRKLINTFIALLGEIAVSDLTQIQIQNATNELFEKGYSERTIREALGVLRECLDSAIINKI